MSGLKSGFSKIIRNASRSRSGSQPGSPSIIWYPTLRAESFSVRVASTTSTTLWSRWILRAHLRLVQRSRILAVESVQTPFHEVLLIGARHEWESAAYKNQFDFVDRMTHSSELPESTLDLELRVIAGFESPHDCRLSASVGPGDPFIGSAGAVCAFSMWTAVRFGHHGNSCNAT